MLPVHRYRGVSAPTHAILHPLSLKNLALVEDICSSTLDLATLDMMRSVAANDAHAQNG